MLGDVVAARQGAVEAPVVDPACDLDATTSSRAREAADVGQRSERVHSRAKLDGVDLDLEGAPGSPHPACEAKDK